MITVVIRRTKDHAYRGFLCMGHAEYSKPGKPDVVCAAVSALTIGTVNSLEELAGERLKVSQDGKTGYLRCDFEGTLQEKSNFLMDAMTFSLEAISREYGQKYLQVKIEEV